MPTPLEVCFCYFQNEVVDLDEFLVGMALCLHGSIKDKCQLLFKMFNLVIILEAIQCNLSNTHKKQKLKKHLLSACFLPKRELTGPWLNLFHVFHYHCLSVAKLISFSNASLRHFAGRSFPPSLFRPGKSCP